jgi:mitogen-activated protein kinase 1/3
MLCTILGNNQLNPLTEYVVTRWYRCPELLLAPNRPYTEAIDLWSIGCILAELLLRKPIFPGKSHADQVKLIFDVVGFNNLAELGFQVTSEASGFLMKKCRAPRQDLASVIPGGGTEAIFLINALLAVNPRRRPSAAQSLTYPYLADAESLCDYSVNYMQKPPQGYFGFETAKLSLDQLRGFILDEVALGGKLPSGPDFSPLPNQRVSLRAVPGSSPPPAASLGGGGGGGGGYSTHLNCS